MAYAAVTLAMTYAFWPQKGEDFYGKSYDDTLPFGTDGIPDVLYEAKIDAAYILKLYKESKADGLIARGDMYHRVGMGPGMDLLYWDVPENQDAQSQNRGCSARPVTVRARSINGNMTYDPNAPETVYGAKDGNSRVVLGQDGWGKPDYQALSAATGWVTQEALVYGNDSIIHKVEGKVIIKYREPRVSSGGTPNNVTKRLSAGLIAWQSEGVPVWYRHMEVRLLPGDPLYTPVYAAFRERNTIRPKARRRLALGTDGALALRSGSGLDGRWFDPTGRALGGTLPTLLPNYR